MYSVSAQVQDLWRRLLLGVGREAGLDLEIVEHAAPAPLEQLWGRADKAAVFMCGLPYSRLRSAAQLIAAPVPSPPDFRGTPRYWSELVVRSDGPFTTLADTFGGRIAFTVPDSQSGYAAPLNHLRTQPGPRPLYTEVIAPCITPLGALRAVLEGAAEVAPIDAYAFALLEHHCPRLTCQVRSVGRTAPTPIPPLVASPGSHDALRAAFLRAHRLPSLHPLMQGLLLARFEVPDPAEYESLRVAFEDSLAYWRTHALARIVHPAFL